MENEEIITDEEKTKGAFKDFPSEFQPKRIPLTLFDELKKEVEVKFGSLGHLFIPDAHLKNVTNKKTTGDMDVVIVPHNRSDLQVDVCGIPGVVATKSNGPQVMCVFQYKKSQYMVDFLTSKPEEFDWKKTYFGFGTLVPAVVGSFARSLRYKFAMDGLYLRAKDSVGNYHNIKLTVDPKVAFAILGLPTLPNPEYNLYTPEGISKWIYDSYRFDSAKWNRPPAVDGQTIVTKNRKSHAAAKKKDEVVQTYKLIDAFVKETIEPNDNYVLERAFLGNTFVDDMIKQIEDIKAKKSDDILTGDELVYFCTNQPGPWIGELKKNIKEWATTHINPNHNDDLKKILVYHYIAINKECHEHVHSNLIAHMHIRNLETQYMRKYGKTWKEAVG